MDEKRLKELGEFLKDVVNYSQPQEGEFTGSEFATVTGIPSRTVRDWLVRAETLGILKSRRTSRYRLYSICNKEEWEKWLNQRNHLSQEKEPT